jgi:hypothetical protein
MSKSGMEERFAPVMQDHLDGIGFGLIDDGLKTFGSPAFC